MKVIKSSTAPRCRMKKRMLLTLIPVISALASGISCSPIRTNIPTDGIDPETDADIVAEPAYMYPLEMDPLAWIHSFFIQHTQSDQPSHSSDRLTTPVPRASLSSQSSTTPNEKRYSTPFSTQYPPRSVWSSSQLRKNRSETLAEPNSYQLSNTSRRVTRSDPGTFKDTSDHFELLMYLTNGLILTEAIATKALTVGRMVTDLLIVGQMPNDFDWIAKLESSNVDKNVADNLQKQFDQLNPLWKLIEDGTTNKVDMSTVSSAVDFIGGMETLKDVTLQYEEFGNIIDIFKNQSEISLKFYKPAYRALIRLPAAIKAFQSVVDPSSVFESIPFGITIIQNVQESNTFFFLQEAIQDCQTFELGQTKDDKLVNCLNNLKNGFMNMNITDKTEIASLNEATKVIGLLGMAQTEWRIFLSDWEELERFSNGFQLINELIKKKQKYKEVGVSKKLKATISAVENLKSAVEQLAHLKNMLLSFQPISEIVDVFTQTYRSRISPNTGSSLKSIVSPFQSYKGLTDGIKSLELLTKKISNAQTVPDQYIQSKLSKKAETIKEWSNNLAPLINASDAIKIVPHFVKLVTKMEQLVDSKNVDGLQNLVTRLSQIESFMNSISPVENIELILEDTAELVSNFKRSNWTDGFDLLKKYVDLGRPNKLQEMFTLFNPLADFIHYAPNVRDAVENVVEVDVKHASYDKLKPSGEIIKKIRDDLPKLLNSAKRLQAAITEVSMININDTNVGRDFRVNKNHLRTVPFPGISNLKESKYDEFEVLDKLEQAEALQKTMKNQAANKPVIDQFVDDSKKHFHWINTNMRTPTSEEAGAIKNLFDYFESKPKIEKSFEKSEAIAKLASGNPIGSDVLEEIYPGVIAYKKMVEGSESVSSLKADITQLKPAYGSLMGKVETMLTGAEKCQVYSNPGSDFYSSLQSLSAVDVNLKFCISWLEKAKTEGRDSIEKDLAGLVASRKSSNDRLSSAAIRLHGFVRQMTDDLPQKLNNLRIGLAKLSLVFSNVDCKKNPEHPSCQLADANSKPDPNQLIFSTTSSDGGFMVWLPYICGAIIIIGSIGVGILVYYVRQKKKKQKAKHLEDGQKSKGEKQTVKTQSDEKPQMPQKNISEKTPENKPNTTNEKKISDSKDDESELTRVMIRKAPPNIETHGSTSTTDMDRREREFELEDEKAALQKQNYKLNRNAENQKKTIKNDAKKKMDETTLAFFSNCVGMYPAYTNIPENERTIEQYKAIYEEKARKLREITRTAPEAKLDVVEHARHNDVKIYKNNQENIRHLPGLVHVSEIRTFDFEQNMFKKFFAMQAPPKRAQSVGKIAVVNPVLEFSIAQSAKLIVHLGKIEGESYLQDRYITRDSTITITSSTDHGCFEETKMQVKKKDMAVEITDDLHHIQFDGWEENRPPRGPEDVVKLIKKVFELHQSSGTLIVICEKGNSLSMMFLSILYFLIRIKAVPENSIMILGYEEMARNRHGFQPSAMEIAFMELVVKKYFIDNESMDEPEEAKKNYDILYSAYLLAYFNESNLPEEKTQESVSGKTTSRIVMLTKTNSEDEMKK